MHGARLTPGNWPPSPAAAQSKAITIDPDAPEPHYALAQVLLTQRHPATARRELERALTLRPDYQDARRALTDLGTAAH